MSLEQQQRVVSNGSSEVVDGQMSISTAMGP